MQLIPNDIRAALLANAARAASDFDFDPEPVVKLFTPDAGATWLFTRADEEGEELRLWGLCDLGLGCPEFGSIMLSTLQDFRGILGLEVERDLHFQPTQPISRYIRQATAAGYLQA